MVADYVTIVPYVGKTATIMATFVCMKKFSSKFIYESESLNLFLSISKFEGFLLSLQKFLECNS